MSNFDSYATGYSPLNALWLARCARLAYQGKSLVEATAQEWAFDQFEFFDCNDTQAFLMASPDLIVLAFRGTESNNLRDWMTDFQLALVAGPFGKVHRGFSDGLDCIWHEALPRLAACRNNEQPLLITGHSLGAALATLATARLRALGKPVAGLYTFGAPRVGDRTFCDTFNADFKAHAFRFVNNNDLVTRIPPRSFGYSHVGRCLYFDSYGKLQTDIRYWNEFLDRVKGSLDDFLKPGPDNIKDHDMGTYEQHLQANLNVLLAAA